MQAALLFEGAKVEERILRIHIELNGENAGWLLAAPGMPMLTAISNDLRRLTAAQSVASPFTEHREFANSQLRGWRAYENTKRGVIPDDALMAGGALGIRFYYLPDLKVIDIFGLTDKTVARNPVTRPNHRRVIAHDRQPPPGYLEQRGVNFTVYPAASSAAQALDRGMYAVEVGPGLWMPFDSDDQQWVAANFAGHDLMWAGGYWAELVGDSQPSIRSELRADVRAGANAAELVGGSQPSIRSDFDVYLVENRLVYVKEQCGPDDVDSKFFVHLDPVDADDLPEHRQQHGFDNLDFSFDRHGARFGGMCLAVVPLPEYAITAIRTGQYIRTDGGFHHPWEGEIRLDE